MRRLLPLTAALLIAALGLLTSTPADAHGRHHRSHVHFGFAFGFPAPLFYPAPVYYPYPHYYYPQPVYVPPPQYVEQHPPPASAPQPPAPAPAAPSQGGSGYYWYYCPDSQTYYPYVQTCASQWQQVVPGSGPPS
jgi:hypothetical protein